MAQPLTLSLELDLDRFLAPVNVRYDSDGEPFGGEPQTVEDIVLGLAAAQVVAGLDREVRSRLAERVRAVRDEVIREQVAPIVAEALSGPVQRTNAYGEPVGEATTLREIITKDAQAALRLTPRDLRGSRSLHDLTPATKVMVAEVDRAVTAEVKAIVQQVKDETRQVIAIEAANAIAAAAS